jgi:hypothetical protein
MDLLPFLNEQVKLFKRTLPETIAITFWHDAAEYLVSADPTSMQQMLMNLVVNARDAMPEGGELQIRLAHFRSDAQHPAPPRPPPPGEGQWLQVSFLTARQSRQCRRHVRAFFNHQAPAGAGLGMAKSRIVGLHEGRST